MEGSAEKEGSRCRILKQERARYHGEQRRLSWWEDGAQEQGLLLSVLNVAVCTCPS